MSFGAERLKNKDGNVFYPVTHASCAFVNWKGETDFSAYTDSDGNSKTYKDKYVDIVTDMSSSWSSYSDNYLDYIRWILDPDNSPDTLYEYNSYKNNTSSLTILLNNTQGFSDYVAMSQVSVKHLQDDTPKLDLSDFDNDVVITETTYESTGEKYFTAALKDTKTADYSGANFAYGSRNLLEVVCSSLIPEGVLKPYDAITQANEYTYSQLGDTRDCTSDYERVKVTLLAPVHPNLFEGVDVYTLTEDNYLTTLADKCRENLKAGTVTDSNITVDSTDDDIMNEYFYLWNQLGNSIYNSKCNELIALYESYEDEFNNKHAYDFIGAHNCVYSSSPDGTVTLSFYDASDNTVAKIELTKITT